MDYVKRAKAAAAKHLAGKRDQSVSNRLDHLDRVRRRALEMAKAMEKGRSASIDKEALQLAALLHDIDEHYEHTPQAIDKSKVAARSILTSIGYPRKKISTVLQLIGEHSSMRMTKASGIESEILYDADKLDGLGATGIARVFSLCGQQGLTPEQAIAWYKKKIIEAIPGMKTSLGRRIARRKLAYVNRFFDSFEREQRELL